MKRIMVFFLVMCVSFSTSTSFYSAAVAKDVKIYGIPVIHQLPSLPTGCEATALTMLLNYFGANLTKEQVANQQPLVPNVKKKDGVRYGGDPNKGFVGSPYDSKSFGIYHEPLKPIINKYFPGRVDDLSGKQVSELYKAIDQSRPVVVWVTIDMTPVHNGLSWILPDGKKFQWKDWNHAMLLVGYTNDYVIMNDPWTGKEQYYKKSAFEKIWADQDRQALSVKDIPRISVTMNGDKVSFGDSQAVLYNDRAYISARFIGEKLGATVQWSQSTQTVTISKGGDVLKMNVGKTDLLKNGKMSQLEAAPILYKGRTLVPLRYISEELGAEVRWAQATSTVTIKSNNLFGCL